MANTNEALNCMILHGARIIEHARQTASALCVGEHINMLVRSNNILRSSLSRLSKAWLVHRRGRMMS